MILIICGWCCFVSLFVEALNTFLERIAIHVLHTCYHSCYHTFMGLLHHFQCTSIISSLPDLLLYALSTYLYHFQRITMPYHHVLKKPDNILFKKLMVKCGNPLENWHLCTILLKICCMKFSNTSGNMLRIITNKNGAKVLWKYGNMYGNGYSNPWESVVTRSIKVREIPKAQNDITEWI